MKIEFDSQPEAVWREKASQFLDVIDNRNGGDGMVIREEILYPRILDHLGDVSGKLMLDGGCGEGTVGRLAMERGARVIGSDIVHEFLEEARSRSGNKEQVVLTSLIHGFPFSSSLFDLVCYNLVLMWIPDIKEVARETGRILKPGGRAVVSLLHPWTALSNRGESQEPMIVVQEGMQPGIFMRTINKTAGPYPFFHRSISNYLNTFAQEGFHMSLDNGFDEVLAPEESSVSLDKKIFPEFLILTLQKGGIV